MNKLPLILFLFLFGFSAFAADSTVSHRTKCEHFHFSNASEQANVVQSYPTLNERIVFDVQDDDPGSKNHSKYVRSEINESFKVHENKKVSVHFSSIEPSSNKGEYNPVLRI